MVVRTGGGVCITVELNRVAFQNILADNAIVRLVDGKDEGSDRVTTVRSLRCVAIYTCFLEVLANERIGRTGADGSADRIMERFEYIQLNAPERTLTIHISGIIVIEAGGMQ